MKWLHTRQGRKTVYKAARRFLLAVYDRAPWDIADTVTGIDDRPSGPRRPRTLDLFDDNNQGETDDR